jgi:hypothetical protein
MVDRTLTLKTYTASVMVYFNVLLQRFPERSDQYCGNPQSNCRVCVQSFESGTSEYKVGVDNNKSTATFYPQRRKCTECRYRLRI